MAAIVPGAVGMSLQVGAVGLILYFAKLLVKGETFSRFGMEIDPTESYIFIFVFAALVAVVLMLSSWMSYFSQVHIIRLGTDYERLCVRRVFSILNRCRQNDAEAQRNPLYRKSLAQLAGQDARWLGRISINLSESIVPAGTCLVAVCVLVFISIPITGLVAVLVGISVFFYEKVSVEGVFFSTRMRITRKATKEEKSDLIDRMATSSQGPDIEMAEIDQWLTTKSFQESLSSYEQRLLTASRATLIGQHLALASIFLLFLLVGAQTVLMKESWSELVVYLVALRYFLNTFQQVAKKLTRINRFYANITRQYMFVVNDGAVPLDSWAYQELGSDDFDDDDDEDT
jgi:hypothetical protein